MIALRNFRHRLFYAIVQRPVPGLLKLGGECHWNILPAGLRPESHVLCAGAGNDISFEMELVRRFGVRPVLVDPSPTGLRTWNRLKESAPGIEFLPVALAGGDGRLDLGMPTDATEGSFRSNALAGEDFISVEARSVSSLMAERGWKRIDLLKMDIEGAEYPVLQSILDENLEVSQICVEFHHGGAFGTTRNDTIRTIVRLLRAGFRLVHRENWDHTFVHRSAL